MRISKKMLFMTVALIMCTVCTGCAKSVDRLIKELEHPDPDVRESAALALSDMGDSKAVEPLIEALNDESYEVRSAAAEALGQIGDPRAVDPLIEALNDETWQVRMFAAYALGYIGDSRAIESLVETSNDEDKNVREGAAFALRKLGESTTAEQPIEATAAYSIDKIITSADPTGNHIIDKVGEVINYQIIVTNDGNVELHGVSVTDQVLQVVGSLSGETESMNDDDVLEVGETWTYTGSYTVWQSDLHSGGNIVFGSGLIVNSATVNCEELEPEHDSAEQTIIPFPSQMFSPVREGIGVPQAASYQGDIHPVVLLGSDGNKHEWSIHLPAEWLPVAVEQTQLVVFVGEEKGKIIETCHFYSGPDIKRYQYSLDVVLHEAKTGEIVASTTLHGSLPRGCRHSEDWSLTRLAGSTVSFEQLQEWLEEFVYN